MHRLTPPPHSCCAVPCHAVLCCVALCRSLRVRRAHQVLVVTPRSAPAATAGHTTARAGSRTEWQRCALRKARTAGHWDRMQPESHLQPEDHLPSTGGFVQAFCGWQACQATAKGLRRRPFAVATVVFLFMVCCGSNPPPAQLSSAVLLPVYDSASRT